MRKSKEDNTFRAIIFTAAVIVIISAVVCIFMLFMRGKELNVKTADSDNEQKGEFIGFVIPAEDKFCSSKEQLDVSVSVKKGASAYAMISGQKISLEASSQSTDGYEILSGSFILPESQTFTQALGNVAFFVTYDGITQICYGGKITVNALSQSENINSSTDNTSSAELLTGTTKALVVTGAITDCKEITENELFFNPTYGNLVLGMTDYVTAKIIDFDDDGKEVEFYKLLSGRAVKADDNVRLIDANSVMTYNSVSLSSQPSSKGRKIIMSETSRVPYKLRYVGQSFTKGYEKLYYNAKPFCAEAVDFIFENTVSFSGSLSDFSDVVVSGVTVSVNPDDKTLILHCQLKRPGKFYGYIMEYDENGNLCISFRQPVRSLSELTVIIDPGHGGNPGAVDYTGKYREADQTLAVSKHLAAYLSSAGATVYMTRTADTEVSLEERRLMNQQIKPDLFISIHLNGAESKSKNGTSTYYFTPFSQPLASFINNRLVGIFSNCYSDNPDMLKNVNGGDRYYPFFVTRTDVCPSVLIELGFFTNELESKYLIDPAYQQAFGKAIYEAVGDFIASEQ